MRLSWHSCCKRSPAISKPLCLENPQTKPTNFGRTSPLQATMILLSTSTIAIYLLYIHLCKLSKLLFYGCSCYRNVCDVMRHTVQYSMTVSNIYCVSQTSRGVSLSLLVLADIQLIVISSRTRRGIIHLRLRYFGGRMPVLLTSERRKLCRRCQALCRRDLTARLSDTRQHCVKMMQAKSTKYSLMSSPQRSSFCQIRLMQKLEMVYPERMR